jgi:putative OPT family oligopeptide transporter
MDNVSQKTDRTHKTTYRELTVAAIVLGILQGVILNVAFVYAALKLGFSIGGSTVAAIMGYALLRGVMKRGTMVENNVNQTIASGINTAGTGMVYTVPALYMLDAKLRAAGGSGLEYHVIPLALAGIAGAILGTAVIVPLRKQMIEFDRLRFPDGVATATIIRAGSSGTRKAILLAIGCLASALWKLVLDTGLLRTSADTLASLGVGIVGEEFHFSLGVIPEYFSPVVSLSLMNMAAGMISGRGGLPFFVGGALSWWFIAPTAVALDWVPAEGNPSASIYALMLRPLGIGVLIGGALMGLVAAFPAIKSAFGSLVKVAKTAGGLTLPDDELRLRAVLVAVGLGWVLFFIAALITPDVTLAQALLASLLGTLWLAVAALIVAQATGMTDISPMSGMALISVTLMMFLLNKNVTAAMVVGVAVSVAIGQGADMMQDLKTGFMIGARPILQQWVQFGCTWIGALIAMAVIHILWTGGPDRMNGFGEGTPLPAPQGGALMGIIEAVRDNNVPVDKYSLGAAIGALLGAAPVAGLGVLIGLSMYLPFSITLGYGIGCFLQMAIQRWKGIAFCEHSLVPLAAGFIVGEALMGVANAFYRILVTGG